MYGILGVGRRVLGYGLLVAGVPAMTLEAELGLAALASGVLLIGLNDPMTRPWRDHVRRWRLPSA